MGYRTLLNDDIERMNILKGVCRHLCSLLDTERENVSAELAETANHSVEAQEVARCLAIVLINMQEACMLACRAVAAPTQTAEALQQKITVCL